jgi:hypothetical protein
MKVPSAMPLRFPWLPVAGAPFTVVAIDRCLTDPASSAACAQMVPAVHAAKRGVSENLCAMLRVCVQSSAGMQAGSPSSAASPTKSTTLSRLRVSGLPNSFHLREICADFMVSNERPELVFRSRTRQRPCASQCPPVCRVRPKQRSKVALEKTPHPPRKFISYIK